MKRPTRKQTRENKRDLTPFKFLLVDDANKLTDQRIRIRSKKKIRYLDVACAFDIETTSLFKERTRKNGETEVYDKAGVMYAWVFGINGRIVVGRTWDEFMNVLDKVRLAYDINPEKRLVIYVHSLAWEFQFFRKRFEWERVFSLEEREPVMALTKDGFEFRCSYKLTGYGLEKVGEHLHKYKIEKMVGDLDYSKPRSPITPLTPKEWNYIYHDGYVVMAHIQEEIERMGGITRIPMTKTGYVRNEARKSCFYGNTTDKFKRKKTYYDYRALMNELTMDVDTYYQLKRAFQGGFTHASSYWVNSTIKDVTSYDFTSSYPAVMCSEMYPMDKGTDVVIKNMKQFNGLLDRYCCMFDIEFTNLRERITTEHPLSLSKCHRGIENAVVDNGRVVRATRVETTLTEQDYFVYRYFYEWDEMKAFNFKYFRKAYLPRNLLDKLLTFYENKTKLKGVDGAEIEYLNSKEMLNAFYGMCVTDPCRKNVTYDNNEWGSEDVDIEDSILHNNASKRRFLFYAWGVWVTAYARRNLFTAIHELGHDYIYSDTDSVKFVNLERHRKYFEEYNRNVTLKVENCLKARGLDPARARPKTIEGVEKPIGVWDFDGHFYLFKTLGAKRYMDVDDKGLHITIAGVNKKDAQKWLRKKYVTPENIMRHFDNGLVFPKEASGRKIAYYIDSETKGTMTDYLGVKYQYDEFSSTCLKASDYNMSMSDEFIAYLRGERNVGIRQWD